MSNLIQTVLDSDEKTDLRQFASVLRAYDRKYFLRNEILQLFDEYSQQYKKPDHRASSRLGKLISVVQEIIVEDGRLCLIIRPKIAKQEAYRLLGSRSGVE